VTEHPSNFEEFIAWQRDLPPEQREERRALRNIEVRETMDRRNREHRIAIAKKLSNLGTRFEDRLLDNFDCPPGDPYALSLAREIAQDPLRRGAWLCGGDGCGKTHLAGAIVNAATSEGIPAAFVVVADLVDQLNDSYDRYGNLRHAHIDVVRWLAEIEVLVLDDIDKAKFTPTTSQRIYKLINKRYENSGSQRKKAVIVTSNHEPAEVAITWRKSGHDRRIGSAIMDRFRELCGQFVMVEGESYRARLMEQA
jgi:DNA replication protein DnaC